MTRCVLCGNEIGSASLGGPNICAACDCGKTNNLYVIPGSKTMKFQIERKKDSTHPQLMIRMTNELFEQFSNLAAKEGVSKQSLAIQMIEYCMKEVNPK